MSRTRQQDDVARARRQYFNTRRRCGAGANRLESRSRKFQCVHTSGSSNVYVVLCQSPPPTRVPVPVRHRRGFCSLNFSCVCRPYRATFFARYERWSAPRATCATRAPNVGSLPTSPRGTSELGRSTPPPGPPATPHCTRAHPLRLHTRLKKEFLVLKMKVLRGRI